MKPVLVGVDIGGTKTAVVFCAEPPHVLWREVFTTNPEQGPEHALQKIADRIQRGCTKLQAVPSCIGVSCGGPLDRTRGIIQAPPNLPTWIDFPIKAILEKQFEVGCSLENDANAGAVAEHRYGAGRGTQNMVFLTMGTGLGAGLILNGEIYHGTNAMAGEIGHVRLTHDGPTGYNKQGSVEGWASGGGMARHGAEVVRQAIAEGELTSLGRSVTTLTARDVGLALADGDNVAHRIAQATGQRLGEALAVLVDVLNPERIVIGGLALRFGEHLLGPAREVLAREALPASNAVCSVVPAQLGEQIGDVAAICVAMGLHPKRS